MSQSFKEFYQTKLRSSLHKELGLSNVSQVPSLSKIVLNIGVKEASNDSKAVTKAADALTLIAGQKAVKTKAKKSVAGFKIREGQAIGSMVTLRGEVMYRFAEKLIKIVLPVVRDFRGVKSKFDDAGNYNLGIKDWMVFSEIDYDNFPTSKGFNITFHIKNGSAAASHALLKGFGMPFVQQVGNKG